ncbi:MAG: hypothetical protein NTW14_08880 [bacterium]|nr:hypothetical protein [bacterium]
MKLDETLKDQRLFSIFSTALMITANSSRILKEGGADPEAIVHINNAIELIAKQLDEAANRLTAELQAVKSVDELFQEMGIPKTQSAQPESPEPE